MFEQGTIKTYSIEQGLGFIEIQGKSQEIIFHVRDLPSPHIEPTIGEEVRFRKTLAQGQIKADHITRLGILDREQTHTTQGNQRKSSTFPRLVYISLLMSVLLLAVVGFNQYQRYQADKQYQMNRLVQEQRAIIAAQRADVDMQAAQMGDKSRNIMKNPGTIQSSEDSNSY